MKKRKLLITAILVLFFGFLSAGAVLADDGLKAYSKKAKTMAFKSVDEAITTAAEGDRAEQNTTAVRPLVYFFWGEGCSHCVKEKAFLEELVKKYPQLEIEDYEIYTHPEGLAKFKEICQNYGVEPSGVPMFFLGEDYIVGFGSDTGRQIEELVEKTLAVEDGGKVAGEKAEKELAPGEGFTLGKIFSLAAADAVNPCALAVLLVMLATILAYNPGKKKDILLAGLAFTFSVFVMYFLYGIAIIKFFQLVQALANIRLFLYKVLGLAAVILGFFNIKESMKDNSSCRVVPKIGRLLSKITNPRGAFVIGALVTIFLLPCTIGPYIITGGLLSSLQIVKTLPWLAFYNFIFVLPMIGVTLVCYAGLATIDDVSSWKERNITKINLLSGIIILFLGLAMLFGWV